MQMIRLRFGVTKAQQEEWPHRSTCSNLGFRAQNNVPLQRYWSLELRIRP